MRIKLLFSFLFLGFGSIYSYQLYEVPIDEYAPNDMLLHASSINNIEYVQKALDQGADINSQDDGYTALMRSVMRGHEAIVKLLLENNANPNVQNNIAQTALMLVVYFRPENRATLNIVKLLLDAGAFTDLVDKEGETALYKANKQGKDSIATFIEAEAEKRKIQKQQAKKEIVETACLLPELADIVLEYANYPT